jgi:CubicO group peptidase (beta-lactamase class C family)
MTATRLNDSREVIPYRVSGYHWLGEHAEQEPAFLTGYHGFKNVLQNAIYISPTRLWAAGAVVSTINDLIKWDAAWTNHLFLEPSSWQQMAAPGELASGTKVNYGFGNELFSLRDHRVAGHQGGGMAFNTTYLRLLDDHISVIVLCNQTTGPSKMMAIHIASILLPSLEYDTSNARPDVKEPKQVTAILKRVLEKARAGQVETSLFAAEGMETAHFIQRAGASYLKEQGELQSIQFLESRVEESRHIYIYRTIFTNAKILWTLECNNEGKIIAINPRPE